MQTSGPGRNLPSWGRVTGILINSYNVYEAQSRGAGRSWPFRQCGGEHGDLLREVVPDASQGEHQGRNRTLGQSIPCG